MENSDDTSAKTRILTVSRTMFARNGYEAVGTQELCVEAKVTKPTLYYHFGNKAGLLSAVCADARQTFLDYLSEWLHYSGDLVSDIRGLFGGVARFAREDADRFQIVLQILFPPTGSTVGEKTQDDAAAITTSLEHFFREVAGGHGNIRGKEKDVAVIFLGHAIALTRIVSAHRERETTEVAAMAAQTFLYGIF